VHLSCPSSTTLADSLYPEEQPANDEDADAQLKKAETECLEARAAYMLRQSVVEDVLIVDPVLKAVHSGANATATERYVARRTNVAGHELTPNSELCIL